AQMRTLLDATTRRRLGANARRAVLPLSPSAITLQLVLLYRDLLAATVQAKTAGKAFRRIAAEPPPTPAPTSSGVKPARATPPPVAVPSPSESASPATPAAPDA